MTIRAAVALAVAMTCSGCASLSGIVPDLSNRVTCAVGSGDAFIVSQWGRVGITGRISELDAWVICPSIGPPPARPAQ